MTTTRHISRAALFAAGMAFLPAAASADAYSDLVAKAEAGEKIDYAALRTAYTRTPVYDPYAIARPAYVGALAIFFKRSHRDACPLIEAALRLNYIEAMLHILRLECLPKGAGLDVMLKRMETPSGLTAAVLKSGDGLTPKTAYRIVTFGEIAQVAGHYHLQLEGIGEVTSNGHRYFYLVAPVEQPKPRPPHPSEPPKPAAPPPPPARWMKLWFNIDAFAASRAPKPKNLFVGKNT